MSWQVGLAAYLAAVFLVASAFAGLLAWSGPVDRPRERGSHASPTPTSGGLAVIAAVFGAAFFLSFTAASAEDARTVGAMLALAGALGLAGAADDVLDLGPRTKLALQVVAALLFGAVVARVEILPVLGADLRLGAAAGLLGTALWLVVVTNAVNFMDGANGLAPGAQAIAFTAFAFAVPIESPLVAGLVFAAAAASFGFLPWNLPLGRVFQGDAGALFAGFLLGALSVVGAERGWFTPWFGPTVLAPLLTDVLLTLAVRARRKRLLLEAHREHLYQLWIQSGRRDHAAAALPVWAVTAACAALALGFDAAGAPEAGFVLAAAACGAGWIVVRRRLAAAVTPAG